MKKERAVLLSFAITILCQISFGQGIQVDPLTGKGNTYIPIYNLTSGSIQVPIGISYSTRGVKVDEGPGLIGYTWGLEAGGEVSREVRGVPDDIREVNEINPAMNYLGWIYASTAASVATFNPNQTETQIYNYLNSINFSQDTEPDLFNVNAPGLNMSFVFGNDGQIKSLRENNNKISCKYDENGRLIAFEVVNDLGVKYIFKDVEYIETGIYHSSLDYLNYEAGTLYWGGGASYAVSWKLSQIVDPVNNKVDFEYDRLLINSKALKVYNLSYSKDLSVYIKDGSSTYKEQQINEKATIFNQLILSRVSSDNKSVDFAIDYIDLGIEDNPEEEDTIPVSGEPNIWEKYDQLNKKALLKRVNIFSGPYFSRNLVNYFEFGYCTRLCSNSSGNVEKQIFLRTLQEGGRSIENPPYKFEYYGINVATGVGTMNAMDSYKVDFWGFPAISSNSFYPTIYIYQTEDADEFYSIIPKNSGTLTKTILGSNRNVDPSNITRGSLKKITFPSRGSQEIIYEPNTFYDSRYYNASIVSSYTGAGIRVKQLILNDAVSTDNNIVTSFEYLGIDGKPSGRLSYMPMYAFTVPYIKNPANSSIQTYDQLTDNLTRLDYLTIRTSKSISDRNNSYVLYERVKETTTNRGYVVYDYNFSNGESDIPAVFGDDYAGSPITEWVSSNQKMARPTSSYKLGYVKAGSYTYPYSPQTDYGFERGLLNRVSMYNENNILVKQDIYTYQRLYSVGSSTPEEVKAIYYDHLPTYYGITSVTTGKMFKYGTYSWLTGLNNVLVKKEEYVYNPSSSTRSLKSSVIYNYESVNHRRISSVISQNSNGTFDKTEKKYVQDYLFPQPGSEETFALNKMSAKNILNLPVEQTTYLLQTQNEVTGGNPKTPYSNILKSSYTQYDEYGRLKSVFNLKNTLAFKPSYIDSYLVNGMGFHFFIQKDDDYVPSLNITSYDERGNATSILENTSLQRSGVHYDYANRGLPILSISGAYAEDVLYNNFSTLQGSTNSFKLIGTWTTDSFAEGRLDKHSLQYYSSSGNSLQGTINNTEFFQSKYFVRFYYHSLIQTSAVIKFKEIGTGNVLYTQTISLPASPYIEGPRVPLAAGWAKISTGINSAIVLPSSCEVEISFATNIKLDDLLFAPEKAITSVANYDVYGNLVATTDMNDQENLIEYDGLNKPKIVRDIDNNIKIRNTYERPTYSEIYSAYFDYERTSCGSFESKFSAVDYDDPTITYEWVFGDNETTINSGTNHEITVNKIYNTVKLKLFKSGSLQDEITRRIDLTNAFTICVDGPTVINKANPSNLIVTDFSSCQRADELNSSVGPTQFNILTHYYPCTNCDWENAHYQWKYQLAGSSTWVNIGTDQPQVTVDLNTTYSILCSISTVCGTVVTVKLTNVVSFINGDQ